MSRLKYDRLFEPIKLGQTWFRNRVFASPQDTYRLTGEGFLNDNGTAFYEFKAMGGFASICLGDMMVDSRAGHSHIFQMRGDDIKGRNSLTRTAGAITRHGAVAAIELNHAGKNSNVMLEKEGFVYGLVDEERPGGGEVRAMDEAWIERLIDCYANAAVLARQCGFGMITILGGHGWLLSQFISARENKRTDQWGGSFENRMRFPLAVVEAVRKRVGRGVPIEMRISACEGLPDGYDIDEGIRIAKALDGKIDLINVSAGHHEIPSASLVSHPPMFAPDGVNVKYAAEIKKHVSMPVSAVGALTDPEMLEELLASGKTDVVEIGRQTLADPDFVLKARTGNEDQINHCLRCFTCFSTSMEAGIFYCSVNPLIGHERDSLNESAPKYLKTVLVAGGGVAGMQAALTAAERGHSVILCEKENRLGGVLRCEQDVPFKEKIHSYLELQQRKIMNSSIDLRLNTAVTKQYALGINPDVIIGALGAVPVIPPIKGIDGKNVFSAETIYAEPSKAGRRVAIVGGGLVGVELGIFLAQLGRKVTIVEMLPSTAAVFDANNISEMIDNSSVIQPGANVYHGIALAEEIKKQPDIQVIVSAKVLEIREDEIIIEETAGTRSIAADTLIYAVGLQARREEANALRDCAPEFYQIGDCNEAANILKATQAAYQIARDIGRM